MDKFSYFLPLSKVEKNEDGSRTISGYASTPALDLDGEVISINAVKTALPSYMEWRNIRLMHQAVPIGVAKEANVDKKGLYLTAKIVDDNAIKLLDEGVLKGFSIGGKKMAKTGNVVTKIELIEISVVDRPCNPECRIDTIKSATLYTSDEEDDESETSFLRGLVKSLMKGTAPTALMHTVDLSAFYDEGNYVELCKRDFSTKEREESAKNGEALPDGSFPIKNTKDLHNAIQAVGRAKDPAKAKAHIKARAKALGEESAIPADWDAKDGTKKTVDPALLTLMKANPTLYGMDIPASEFTLPPELTAKLVDVMKALGVTGKREEAVRDRIAKGCHVLADLVYAFGMLRDAQRRLLIEGAVEKDGDDEKLSQRIGQIASELATVMAQKAEHEGSEALYLTDCDDLRFFTYNGDVAMQLSAETMDLIKRASAKANAKAMQQIQKAGKAHAEGMKCLMKCGQLMGKAAGGQDLNKADFMGHMTKAHEFFSESMDHMEMAHLTLGKSAVTEGGDTVAADTAARITPISETERTEGEVPWYNSHEPYAGKQTAKTVFTQEQVDALVKAGTAEAEKKALQAENERLQSLLKSTPADSRRPIMFSTVNKTAIVDNTRKEGEPTTDAEALYEGVDIARVQSGDGDYAIKSAGMIVNNMFTYKDRFAKSVFDPSFRGKAGLTRQ